MKQLSKSNNQFDLLDPEKIYFVEKFGYLVKKINGGYGGHVQAALFARINNTVNNFKTDLPNIVHGLEINRQKIISSQKTINTSEQISKKNKPISKLTVSARATEATRIISEKINVAEKKSVAQKSSVDKKEIEIINLLVAKHSSDIKKKALSILRPSVAAIREEQRLEQIKAMQQKKESFNTGSIRKQSMTKAKPKPVQEFTEWEKRWHKYDTDIVDREFDGYLNN